jgi:ATP-dependent helicase/nuclease subunit B
MKRVICTPLDYNLWPEYARICGTMTADGQEGWIYLLPTREMLTSVQRTVWSTEGLVGCSRLNLFSLDGLVELVLNTAGQTVQYLEETEALAVLNGVVRQLGAEQRLSYYRRAGDRHSYLKGILGAIGELKRQLISPEELDKAAAGLVFPARLKELALIYNSYQQVLEEQGYAQQEELYIKATELLQKEGKGLLSGFNSLFMSNYFEFAPVKESFLARVIALIPRVEINLPYDLRNPQAYQLTEKTLNLFKEWGLEISYAEGERRNHVGGEICQDLFSRRRERIQPEGRIGLTCYQSREGEIRGLAREIKGLILKEDYQPAQICVLPRMTGEYVTGLIRVFEEYGIPLDCPEEISLPFHPLVRGLIRLFRLKPEGMGEETILQTASSPYWAEPLGLEIGALKEIFSGRLLRSRGDWDQLLAEEDQDNSSSGGIANILELIDRLPERGEPGQFARILRSFLEQIPLREQIIRLQAASEEDRKWSALKTDLTALSKLEEILEQFEQPIYDLFGEISSEQFLYLFLEQLAPVRLIVREGEIGGVRLLDPSSARGQEFAVVFLPGLEEGIFPRQFGAGWVIPEPIRKKMSRNGFSLPGLEEREKEEQFFLAAALSTARERVYLSYSEGTVGKESLRSWFVDEIGELFPGGELPVLPADLGISRPAASRRELVGSLALLYPKGGKAALEGLDLELPFAYLSRVEMENSRFNLGQQGFTCYNGSLEQSRIQEELSRIFHSQRSYSPAMFKDYALCPFAFFAERVLGLTREETVGKLDGLQRGRIYHEVLALFMGSYRDKKLKIQWRDKYLNQLETLLNEVVNKEEFRSLVTHPRWSVQKQLLLRTLQRWLDQELSYGSSFLPRYLEWSFGLPLDSSSDPDSTERPLELVREGETIRFRGRVDRIDYAEDGLYQVFDYKTSSVPGKNDLLNLFEPQVLIYLLAVEQLLSREEESVVGGGYYSLKTGKRDGGIWLKEQVDHLPHRRGRRGWGTLSRGEWEDFFVQFREELFHDLEAIKAGKFYVEPKKACSPYCRFKTVCRYDQLQTKGGE